MEFQKNPEFELRKIRNALLRDCDWTQFSDSPLNDAEKKLWANYRKELRDLPANSNLQLDENNNLIGFELPKKPE
jgi:hypothetical protein